MTGDPPLKYLYIDRRGDRLTSYAIYEKIANWYSRHVSVLTHLVSQPISQQIASRRGGGECYNSR